MAPSTVGSARSRQFPLPAGSYPALTTAHKTLGQQIPLNSASWVTPNMPSAPCSTYRRQAVPVGTDETRWLASRLTDLSGFRVPSAVGTRITWEGGLWLTRASVLIRLGRAQQSSWPLPAAWTAQHMPDGIASPPRLPLMTMRQSDRVVSREEARTAVPGWGMGAEWRGHSSTQPTRAGINTAG